MTDISPAAQAVVTAIEKFDWEAGHFSRENIWMLSREVTAAALRAAADQLKFADDYGTRLINADDLLAIAIELESHQ